MLEKEGGATAPNSGPAHVDSSPNDCATHSENAPETQVRNGPAPLHLLVDQRHCRCTRTNGTACGCVPAVVSWLGRGSVFVGIRNPVWGHGAKVREFLGAPKAAERYRLALWEELRVLAWAEADRRDRHADAKLREIIARNGGGL